jgi:ribonuclease-3
MSQVGDDALRECASRLGYSFINEDLLRVALIHRSWQAEHDSAESNERLEFLGDAVLGWAVADIAYHRLADMHEGKLTDLRISVVNMNALADRARALGIGEFVFLGKGEDAAGGRDKASILSDTFEALIGAVYLDGGASAAYDLVRRLLSDSIEDAIPNMEMFDAKSRLQELTARLGFSVPRYVTEGEGPDHERVFTTAVYVEGRVQGRGTGRTKKAAEQAAAVEACGALAHADNA